jgi:hypothetical protein
MPITTFATQRDATAVSFFDDFPPPPPPPQPPPFEPPAGTGPPPGWAGGWVGRALVHTADAWAAISGFEVFPTGLAFNVAAMFRPGSSEYPPHGHLHPMLGMPDGPRVGVVFADGRRGAMGRPIPALGSRLPRGRCS